MTIVDFMNIQKGKKITIFTDEETRYHGHLLYETVLTELNRIGIRHTSVSRGMAGFGRERKIATTKIEALSFDLPIIIEATDTEMAIDSALATLAEMINGQTVDIKSVEIVLGN